MALVHPAFVSLPVGGLFLALTFTIIAFLFFILRKLGYHFNIITELIGNRPASLFEQISYYDVIVSLLITVFTALTGLYDASKTTNPFNLDFIIIGFLFAIHNAYLSFKIRWVIITFEFYLISLILRNYLIYQFCPTRHSIYDIESKYYFHIIYNILHIGGFFSIMLVSATGGRYFFGSSLIPNIIFKVVDQYSILLIGGLFLIFLYITYLWITLRFRNTSLPSPSYTRCSD